MNDVVVVGGGIIGVTTALRLAQSGVAVTLLEQGRVGGQATVAAAGMLAPFSEQIRPGPLFDLAWQSLRVYSDLAHELFDTTGLDVEFRQEGTLFLLDEAHDAAIESAEVKRQQELDPGIRLLDATDIANIEPSVARHERALFYPSEGQVQSPRLIKALTLAAVRAGVEIRTGEPVLGLLRQGSRVTGVRSTRSLITADETLIAAGAWSAPLLEDVGLVIPIAPRRGQVVGLGAGMSGLRHVVFKGHGYLAPKVDGSVIAGATEDDAGFDTAVTVHGLVTVLQYAKAICPVLAQSPVLESWAGLRPMTADGLPVLGRPSGIDGLILASGHYRNGILLAPITAQAIAQILLTGEAPMDLSAFSPDRFL